MAGLPEEGTFEKQIFSRIAGRPPVGINFVKPTYQNVFVGGNDNTWEFTRHDDDGTYTLSIGPYRYTRVIGDRVVVSTDLERPEEEARWKLLFSERQSAFVIILRSDIPGVATGWTVPEDSRDIRIKPIKVGLSEPPTYATGQLFELYPGIY